MFNTVACIMQIICKLMQILTSYSVFLNIEETGVEKFVLGLICIIICIIHATMVFKHVFATVG